MPADHQRPHAGPPRPPLDPFEAIFDSRPASRPLHPAALDDESLMAQCTWSRGRSGGPGGQNRNKVETAVEIVHRPTGLSARSQEHRSVKENKRVAIRRLRLLLATEFRVDVPPGECRSDLWRGRVRGGRIALSDTHRDHPTMLAEALDVVAASGQDIGRAAVRLDCTPSQLVKLLRSHPPALVRVNEARRAAGEHPLK